MRADNPVHGVMRFADGRRERRLRDGEYAAPGAALRQGEADGIWPAARGGSAVSCVDGLAHGRGAVVAMVGCRLGSADPRGSLIPRPAVRFGRCRTRRATCCAPCHGW
jgi:hypothetical protein